MTDDDLNALFERHKTACNVDVNAQAKRRSIDLAVEEFNRLHAQKALLNTTENNFQGFWVSLRLTFRNFFNREEKSMNQPTKWIYSGVATASLVTCGVLFVSNYPNTTSSDLMGVDTKTERAISLELGGQELGHQELGHQKLSNQEPSKPLGTLTESKGFADLPAASTENTHASINAVESQKETAPSRQTERSLKKAQELLSQATDTIASPSRAARVGSSMTAEHSKSAKAYAPAPARTVTRGQAVPSLSRPLPSDILPTNMGSHRDDFEHFAINPVKLTREQPVSTFSIDVDTASYSYVRQRLNQGVLPPKDAVRIEEMINYFSYDYPSAQDKAKPFRPSVVVSDSVWAKGKKLIHIGIKGYELDRKAKPKSNLVFLLDVSGSMNSPAKLPLVKQSMSLLLSQLRPDDTVAIVVYAGAAGTVLKPTAVKDKATIMNALSQLQAGGSTSGAQGIELAYELAEINFDKRAVNRILLATDGDFNVGIRNRDELKGFIERKRDKGIYLSVLGFGQGNYQDHLMQTLAQNGNGIAAYIDTLSEAQKVLINESTSTLFPIANDVKIQVEFNPEAVAEYRLIGYETRALKREDFNNDNVDAGDIGAGHTVTAIYEITPVDSDATLIDDLRYSQEKTQKSKRYNKVDEYGFLKLRYKLPGEKTSSLLSLPISSKNMSLSQLEENSVMRREIRFSTAVAAFAQQLKDPSYLNDWSYQQTIDLAQANKGEDLYGYRTEFVQLVRKAMIAADITAAKK